MLQRFALFLLLMLHGLTPPAAAAPRMEAVDMRLTIYDDGRSCPGNCDAHFVTTEADNGSPNAFLPSSERWQDRRACVPGQTCRICFGHADDTCMNALFRGSGPHARTFDFTPAFYEQNCPRQDIPAALAAQCAVLARAAESFVGRLNCIRDRSLEGCAAVMEAAEQRRREDEPKYEQCRSMGQAAYNHQFSNARDRRSNGCAYSELSLGRNSRGKTWKHLLPAACRPGTFVGRDGLDCCSGSELRDAAFHVECSPFYLRRQTGGPGSNSRRARRG